eukprot:350264-Chlamydomonas_euryale.AAC.11
MTGVGWVPAGREQENDRRLFQAGEGGGARLPEEESPRQRRARAMDTGAVGGRARERPCVDRPAFSPRTSPTTSPRTLPRASPTKLHSHGSTPRRASATVPPQSFAPTAANNDPPAHLTYTSNHEHALARRMCGKGITHQEAWSPLPTCWPTRTSRVRRPEPGAAAAPATGAAAIGAAAGAGAVAAAAGAVAAAAAAVAAKHAQLHCILPAYPADGSSPPQQWLRHTARMLADHTARQVRRQRSARCQSGCQMRRPDRLGNVRRHCCWSGLGPLAARAGWACLLQSRRRAGRSWPRMAACEAAPVAAAAAAAAAVQRTVLTAAQQRPGAVPARAGARRAAAGWHPVGRQSPLGRPY